MPNSAMPAHRTNLPATDWWDNPITQTCTVAWCEGDCVLGGPGELAHHRTVTEMPVRDGVHPGRSRRLLVMLQQSGDEGMTVYVSTGDSDDHGVEMPMDQAERYFAAGLAAIRDARRSYLAAVA